MSEIIVLLDGTLNYKLRYANKLCQKDYNLLSDYRISKCFRTKDEQIIRSIILYNFRLYLMKGINVIFNLRNVENYREDIENIIVEFNKHFDACLRVSYVKL